MNNHVPALPVELISRILDFVASKSTLCSAALCSKHWNQIVTPHLYRDIRIWDANYVNELYSTADWSNEQLRHLVVLLLRRSDLAKHVHHFSIHSYLYDEHRYRHSEPPKQTLRKALESASGLEDELKDAIAKYSKDNQEHAKWLELATIEDSIVALLLPSLVNLESLDVEVGRSKVHYSEPTTDFFIERVLRRIALREAPFDSAEEKTLSKLRSFAWMHYDPRDGDRITEVGFLFPSVTHAFFHHIRSDDEHREDVLLLKVPPRSSATTHLELKDCRFHDRDIKILLSRPTQLRTFIYEIGHVRICPFAIDFEVLHAMLQLHTDTLENIWLTYPHQSSLFDDLDADFSVPSLAAFTHLKRLRISPELIVGFKLSRAKYYKEDKRQHRLVTFLPPSIEELHLDHANKQRATRQLIYSALSRLLQNHDSFPNLRRITLELSITHMGQDSTELLAIRDAANAAGIITRFLNNYNDTTEYRDVEKVERRWGMDDEFEHAPCSSDANKAPPSREVVYNGRRLWIEQETGRKVTISKRKT